MTKNKQKYGKYIDNIEGYELLKELHEENKELKQENAQLRQQLQSTSDQRDEFHCGARENANRVGQLGKENKELKEEIEELKKDCKSYTWYKLYKKLLNENEQLKQSIKEVLELLEEEVDVFSDKALEHDICAYIELNELDNKDAYYMAISTKKAIKILKEMI